MKIIFGTLLLLPCLAFAAEWQHISRSDDLLMQIDTSSIVLLKDGSRKAWKEFIYEKPQVNSQGKTYIRIVMFSIYNCSERTVAPIQEVDYDHIINGAVVSQVSTPQRLARYLEVVPESFDEAALDFICTYKPKKK